MTRILGIGLATLTGGQAFDSRNVSLASVFKVIRGYQ